jgi:Protein of unknown function (DUF4013)
MRPERIPAPAVTGESMDFAEMLGDAFSYTREGVLGNMNRWLKLILAIICLGLPFNGYIMRVYRGKAPAPEADEWGTLFIDGLKLLVVGIVYAIPLVILWAFIYGPFFLGIASGTMKENALATWEPNFVLMLIFYVVELAVTIIMPVASIRFARTGTFAEAFNLTGIFETIGRIGWINYIVALLLVSIVVSIPILVLIIGFILVGTVALVLLKEAALLVILALLALAVLLILILAPLFGIFQARYMTRLYDCAAPAVMVIS